MRGLMRKEESIASNSMEKLLEDKGHPFKKINEDCMNWMGMWTRIGMSQEVLIAPDTTTRKNIYSIFFEDAWRSGGQ